MTIGYEITIHRCEDGLTSNTPKTFGSVFGDELYQTRADSRLSKSTLWITQRIVYDEPVTVIARG
jgi:hypothetical protein